MTPPGALAGASVGLLVGATVASTAAALAADRRMVAVGRGEGRSVSAVPPAFGRLVARWHPEGDPERLWPLARLLGGVLVIGSVWQWPALGLVGLLAGAVGVAVRRGSRADTDAAVRAALPAAIDALVASLASGASLGSSLEVAGRRPDPAGRELARVVAAQRVGAPLLEALDAAAERRPGSGLPLLADALALAGTTGGSQVAALTGVAATLREREALGREVRALGAQAQLSAGVLVAVPVGFAAVVALLDRRIAGFLLTTAGGWACASVGLALDLAGAWWMRRLIGRFR